MSRRKRSLRQRSKGTGLVLELSGATTAGAVAQSTPQTLAQRQSSPYLLVARQDAKTATATVSPTLPRAGWNATPNTLPGSELIVFCVSLAAILAFAATSKLQNGLLPKRWMGLDPMIEAQGAS